MPLFGLEDRQWIVIATIVYAAAFVLGTYSALKLRRKTGRPYMISFVSFGWILQTIGLYARGLQYGGCPLANTFELAQFLVWSSTAIYIFVGPAFRVSLLGVFTSAFSAIVSTFSLFAANWDSPDRTPIFGDTPWIETHAALALFSYGVFGVLTLTSFMYLLQSRSLKMKTVGGFFPYLPSIVELSHINTRLLVIGFIILSASLGIGSVYWAKDIEAVLNGKLFATIAVWTLYGILLLLRFRQIVAAKRFAQFAITIFVLALLSLGFVSDDKPTQETPAPSLDNERK